MTKISLTIERLEDGRAFLKDEKGRLIVWPRDFLPTNALIGQSITFSSEPNEAKADGNELPKKILNEILISQ